MRFERSYLLFVALVAFAAACLRVEFNEAAARVDVRPVASAPAEPHVMLRVSEGLTGSVWRGTSARAEDWTWRRCVAGPVEIFFVVNTNFGAVLYKFVPNDLADFCGTNTAGFAPRVAWEDNSHDENPLP